MKRILIVTIAYRVGERIYPIIPELAKEYTIDLLRVYQMHPGFKWPGDYDMRSYFESTYDRYLNKIFFKKEDVDYSKYHVIIYDDCRINNGGEWIYQQSSCPVISCSHGNGDNMYLDNFKRVYDKLFLFGKKEVTKSFIVAAGIPANDKLSQYTNIKKEHILVVVNFLGNHNAPFHKFDSDCFSSLRLLELQQIYKLPIVIKLKSRHNNGSVYKDYNYLLSILPKELQFNVIVDTMDDNLLIARSLLVLGAPSTLMIKPIQLKIPTVMFSGYGQTGIFYDYPGIKKLNSDNIISDVKSAMETPISNSFIENTVSGGSTFSSTKTFIQCIKEII